MNTLLFANITFVIDRIVQLTNSSACIFLCLLLAMSSLVLYRSLRKELVTIKWIKRCCYPKEGKLKSYKIKHESFVDND